MYKSGNPTRSQASVFLRIRYQSSIHQIKSRLTEKWMEISVTLLIIIGLMTGGYLLFRSGAIFLMDQGEIGQLLLNRIFYLVWSIIFYMLIVSNIITAFSTLYRSQELSLLMTLPVSYLSVFRLKSVENLLYSSWALLILGLPLTLAYGHVNSSSLLGIVLFFPLGILPFLIIAASVGIFILMMVVWFSKWFRMKSVFFSLGIIFTALFWLYFRFSQQETLLVGDMGSFRALGRYMSNLTQTPFPLIPSYWLSELMTGLTQKNWQEIFYYTGILLSTSLVGWEAIQFTAKVHYYPTFQLMMGSSRRKGEKITVKAGSSQISFWNRFTPQTRGLLIKDIKQFTRTPQQWVQFLIFGIFIILYLLNLSRAEIRIGLSSPFWQTILHLLNFGFSGFILASLTSRFVFPLISLEGDSFWIILSSPVNVAKLFKQKFWLSFVIFFSLAEIVGLVSNYYIGLSYFISLITTVFLILMSLSLTSLALGLGAVFPQFHEQNPMRISSSAGGIITVILSLVYVAIMAGALVLFLIMINNEYPVYQLSFLFSGVILFNGVVTYLPLRWGYRSLLRIEL